MDPFQPAGHRQQSNFPPRVAKGSYSGQWVILSCGLFYQDGAADGAPQPRESSTRLWLIPNYGSRLANTSLVKPDTKQNNLSGIQ